MNVQYAFARQEDENQIRELLRESGLPDDDITAHLSNFITARIDSSIIGCVGLEVCDNSALLRSLAVLPDYRSTGIGGELCRRLTDYARDHGYTTLYLLTTSAENYFRRIGYERISRSEAPAGIQQTEQFRNLCPSSAVLMKTRV